MRKIKDTTLFAYVQGFYERRMRQARIGTRLTTVAPIWQIG